MESLIDIEDFPGRLLPQAALWDNAELLEDLLNGEELGYINSSDSWGRSPVHAAATTESSMCLRILIQVMVSVLRKVVMVTPLLQAGAKTNTLQSQPSNASSYNPYATTIPMQPQQPQRRQQYTEDTEIY